MTRQAGRTFLEDQHPVTRSNPRCVIRVQMDLAVVRAHVANGHAARCTSPQLSIAAAAALMDDTVWDIHPPRQVTMQLMKIGEPGRIAGHRGARVNELDLSFTLLSNDIAVMKNFSTPGCKALCAINLIERVRASVMV